MSLVTIKNVSKIYGTGHTAVAAVNKVSLQINAGDIILIMGPSGSGKTTLLSMIGSLLRPSSGAVMFEKKRIDRLKSNELTQLRLHELGFIFQTFNLLSALSAVQNVMVPLMAAGHSRKEATKRSEELLRHLQLGHRLNNLPKDLSGGEKQRVAIARSLANQPKLILADEPTANLDGKTGHKVMQLLCNTACEENKALVIVSHDERLKDVAKRVITIEDGQLTKEAKGYHEQNCSMRH